MKGENKFSFKFICLPINRSYILIWDLMDSMMDEELLDHLSYRGLECQIGAEERKEHLIIKSGWSMADFTTIC